jgi:hypothetical protein
MNKKQAKSAKRRAFSSEGSSVALLIGFFIKHFITEYREAHYIELR